jgi:pentalenene oxygenase
MLRDHLAFMNELPSHGDLVQIRLGPLKVIVVSSPELTRQLLLEDATFDKGGPLFDRIREVLGNGVITCPHTDHRRQRRLIQPAFHRTRMPGYAREMSGQATGIIDAWTDGQLIDATAAMQHVSARSLAATMFAGALPPNTLGQTLQDIDVIWAGWAKRLVLPAVLGRVPTPGRRRYQQANGRLRRTIGEVATNWRNNGIDHGDLMSILLAARDDPTPPAGRRMTGGTAGADGRETTGSRLSDTEVFDQMMTLLTAGIETVAGTLAWALYLLARHPEIQRKLNAEVDLILRGGAATYEQVPALKLAGRIVTETLRLYPPPWFVTRTAIVDTVLGGHHIPAGTTLAYSSHLLHHRSDLFPDPERFDPDRWLPENAGNIPPGAYIPFGHGARKCAGDTFAMTEAVLVLASLSARWWLQAAPDVAARRRPPRPSLGVTIKPPKLPLRVLARTGSSHPPSSSPQE